MKRKKIVCRVSVDVYLQYLTESNFFALSLAPPAPPKYHKKYKKDVKNSEIKLNPVP